MRRREKIKLRISFASFSLLTILTYSESFEMKKVQYYTQVVCVITHQFWISEPLVHHARAYVKVLKGNLKQRNVDKYIRSIRGLLKAFNSYNRRLCTEAGYPLKLRQALRRANVERASEVKFEIHKTLRYWPTCDEKYRWNQKQILCETKL